MKDEGGRMKKDTDYPHVSCVFFMRYCVLTLTM